MSGEGTLASPVVRGRTPPTGDASVPSPHPPHPRPYDSASVFSLLPSLRSYIWYTHAQLFRRFFSDADKPLNHDAIRTAPLWKGIGGRFERGAVGNPGGQIELACLKRGDDTIKIGGQSITTGE